jgi:hypothetical protein
MALGLAYAANADIIAGYDFTGGTAAATTNAADVTAGDVSLVASNLSINDTVGDNSGYSYDTQVLGDVGTANGAMLVPVTATGATTTFAEAVLGDDYFSFTVDAAEGSELNLTSLTFKATMKAATSIDEYALADASGNIIGTSWQVPNVLGLTAEYDAISFDLSDAAYQGLTEETEFRIYFWGRGTSATANTVAAVDKVVLNGSVTAIPEPATIGMLGLGAAALLAFRRRMK